jgi:hypothetical protein
LFGLFNDGDEVFLQIVQVNLIEKVFLARAIMIEVGFAHTQGFSNHGNRCATISPLYKKV